MALPLRCAASLRLAVKLLHYFLRSPTRLSKNVGGGHRPPGLGASSRQVEDLPRVRLKARVVGEVKVLFRQTLSGL